MNTRRTIERYEGTPKRLRNIAVGLMALLCVLVGRLWWLQVVNGAEYARQADENRLRPLRLKAPRGMIVDRNDEVLADNRAACDLVLVPKECGDPEEAVARLASILTINSERLLKEIEDKKGEPYRQIVVKQDISKVELARVEERAYQLPGIFTIVRPQRRYMHGRTAGQVMGYMSEIGPDELKRRPDYHMGDYIGMSGLERMYESVLRGRDGSMLINVYANSDPQMRTDAYGNPYIEMDSVGQRLDMSSHVAPAIGGVLRTTIDIGLQMKAEQLLMERPEKAGAAVVLNADTGAVLALASVPGFDPGIFVSRGRSRERSEALSGEMKPARHRAYQEVYPPGSVFKVMLALAALEEGVIDQHTSFYCPGSFRINGKGRPWACWQKHGHGTIQVEDALAYSCDVFFYNVGLKLGVDKINEWGKKLSLGDLTGIDLPRGTEVPGLIPSREWKKEILEKLQPDRPWDHQWFPGDTVNLSIGQGSMAATPLQCAVLCAVVVNGGKRITPHLNRDLDSASSPPLLSDKTLELVRNGMFKCVDDEIPPSGTGRNAKLEGYEIIGKTGTAQTVAKVHYEDYKSEDDIPYPLRDHAWFVAGVLNHEPRISVAVLVEHGLHGSSAAAPVARDLIKYFYESQPMQSVQMAKQDE